MAGLLRAPAARTLVGALRQNFDLPVHLHTHDTAGGQLATYLAAMGAGVDAIDGALGPMAGTTSQPSLGAIVAATDHTDKSTGLSLEAIEAFEPYWEAVRHLYAPFDIGLPAPTTWLTATKCPGARYPTSASKPSPWGWAIVTRWSRIFMRWLTASWAIS